VKLATTFKISREGRERVVQVGGVGPRCQIVGDWIGQLAVLRSPGRFQPSRWHEQVLQEMLWVEGKRNMFVRKFSRFAFTGDYKVEGNSGARQKASLCRPFVMNLSFDSSAR